jgi:hypothetical protein
MQAQQALVRPYVRDPPKKNVFVWLLRGGPGVDPTPKKYYADQNQILLLHAKLRAIQYVSLPFARMTVK